MNEIDLLQSVRYKTTFSITTGMIHSCIIFCPLLYGFSEFVFYEYFFLITSKCETKNHENEPTENQEENLNKPSTSAETPAAATPVIRPRRLRAPIWSRYIMLFLNCFTQICVILFDLD